VPEPQRLRRHDRDRCCGLAAPGEDVENGTHTLCDLTDGRDFKFKSVR
jgi:hypothetical protein